MNSKNIIKVAYFQINIVTMFFWVNQMWITSKTTTCSRLLPNSWPNWKTHALLSFSFKSMVDLFDLVLNLFVQKF